MYLTLVGLHCHQVINWIRSTYWHCAELILISYVGFVLVQTKRDVCVCGLYAKCKWSHKSCGQQLANIDIHLIGATLILASQVCVLVMESFGAAFGSHFCFVLDRFILASHRRAINNCYRYIYAMLSSDTAIVNALVFVYQTCFFSFYLTVFA